MNYLSFNSGILCMWRDMLWIHETVALISNSGEESDNLIFEVKTWILN